MTDAFNQAVVYEFKIHGTLIVQGAATGLQL